MYSTSLWREVRAEPDVVYRALVDPSAVVRWRAPAGMTATVHEFEPVAAGRFRVSLTYDGDGLGKSAPRTDTYAGRFARLVPSQQVVEVMRFESDDPALCHEMTMTTTLAGAEGGTMVRMVHEGVPDAVDPAANELGMRQALANLAALVER